MIAKKCYAIESDHTILSWDEGLPLGNGDIGAMIWSDSDRLRFSLDKGDIWDCSYRPQDQPDFTYQKLTEWAKKGKISRIRRVYDKNGYMRPTPTKLPVGKLILNLGVQANVVSRLDLTTAEAELHADSVKVNAFVSAKERVGYICADTPTVQVQLENPEFGMQKKRPLCNFFSRKPRITASLQRLHYPMPEKRRRMVNGVFGQAEQICFVQQVSDHFSYATMVEILRSTEDTLIVYTVVSSHDGSNFLEYGERLLADALDRGYAASLADHVKWWAGYWEKSAISIPDVVLERSWYIGNYLLAACSRRGFYPMPLQGLWTADNGELPPWKGDYHHDLNTQLCYQSYGKANHLDEGACFIDYLIKLTPQAERFARTYYGTDGLCLPAVMDIRGEALGGWPMYSLSPTNQLWLCDIIFRHYAYTQDLTFLRDQAYPYAAASMWNIIALLEERGGKYYLPWSSSSEIYDDTRRAFLRPNSNYDLSLMRAALINLIRYAAPAGRPQDAEKYQKILDRMDPLAVTPDHILMLDPKEQLLESHRHHSHAMAIFPLRLLDYDQPGERRIIDATIADLEKLGTQNWCGYFFAWMAQFYCVQRNGEKAARILNQFWRYFCLPNGFHVNGDYTKQGLSNLTYRPFTLEGTFCAVSAIQEMLLYCENGVIEPLRAVPKTWRDIEFKNLLGSGGVLVSLKYRDGTLQYLSLQAAEDQDIELIHHFQGDFRSSIPFERSVGRVQLHLSKGVLAEMWSE